MDWGICVAVLYTPQAWAMIETKWSDAASKTEARAILFGDRPIAVIRIVML
jgi:hypothetical protein